MRSPARSAPGQSPVLSPQLLASIDSSMGSPQRYGGGMLPLGQLSPAPSNRAHGGGPFRSPALLADLERSGAAVSGSAEHTTASMDSFAGLMSSPCGSGVDPCAALLAFSPLSSAVAAAPVPSPAKPHASRVVPPSAAAAAGRRRRRRPRACPMSAVAPLTAVPSKGERVHYSRRARPSLSTATLSPAAARGVRDRAAPSLPARARAPTLSAHRDETRRRRHALAPFPSTRALRKRARARLRPFSSRSAVNPVPAPVSTAVKHSNGVGDKPIVAASPARHDRAPMPSAPANQSNKMPMFEESPSPIDQHRNVTGM